MNTHEDDHSYENLEDIQPKRSPRTKFRDYDDDNDAAAKRDKRSRKRSHRPKTVKEDLWPDADD